MKNLKVGDKVKIKQDLVFGKFYNDCMYTVPMEKYAGKVATVTEVFDSETGCPNYYLDIDKGKWFWDSEMIEPVEEVERKICNEEESVRLAKAVCEYEEIVHNLEQELKECKRVHRQEYNSLVDDYNELLNDYNSLVDDFNEVLEDYKRMF